MRTCLLFLVASGDMETNDLSIFITGVHFIIASHYFLHYFSHVVSFSAEVFSSYVSSPLKPYIIVEQSEDVVLLHIEIIYEKW